MIYGKEGILRRWQEYCKKLFSDTVTYEDDGDVGEAANDDGDGEPEVLLDVIRNAIEKMKKNKAVGLDGIPAEALKAGGDTVVNCLKSVIDVLKLLKSVILVYGQMNGQYQNWLLCQRLLALRIVRNIEL